MNQGHLSRRLARAARHEQERRRAEDREAQALRRDKDRFDHTLMELSDAPSGNRPFCTPSGHYCSESSGTYHVGGQVRSLRGGLISTTDESRADGKAHPTSYSPDPRLKGGVG
jgi:hypothetical protein